MGSNTFLVTGSNGQLGKELQQIATAYPAYQFLFCDKSSLDISNKATVKTFFQKEQPAICINAAAYTQVDKAETEREMAFVVNAEGAANLAEACKEWGATLIHISTDYVFDGTKTSAYTEEDPLSPIGIYARSKAEGERLVQEKSERYYIIRTDAVYSTFGHNFVKTMLLLGSEKEKIKVVDDQWVCPTYAADLAQAIMNIIGQLDQPPPYGIYQYSNEGLCTWYELASAAMEYAGLACKVLPITTAEYPTPAQRPLRLEASKEKIKKAFGLSIPHWQVSLQKMINLYQA